MLIQRKLFLFSFSLLTILNSYAQPAALAIGAKAPLFKAKAHSGDIIDLRESLKKGPVVLFFYRGSWCPYCNRQMAELQDSLKYITGKGASVIGVTPETNESMNKIIVKSGASFPLVHDEGYKIMNSYGVSFKMDTATITKYKKYDIFVDKANGNNDYTLPVPATYVIGKDGRIKYVHFDTDYRKRATVGEILKYL